MIKSLGASVPAKRRPKANVGPAGIVMAAERLFGEHGIDTVSLRQVSAAAGLANNYSVQYHFTDRLGLLRAIFELRLPAIDARRAVLIDELKAKGVELTDTALLDCLYRPFLELSLQSGNGYLASVLGQVLRSPTYRELRKTYGGLTPCGYGLAEELRQILGIEREDVFVFRHIAASTIVLDAIFDPTLYGLFSPAAEAPQVAYELALTAAIGCLRAVL